MVKIGALNVCIDTYEASRGDDGSAVSKSGATPWVVKNWNEASEACVAADKRLCKADEWLQACQGQAKNTYPYGASYDAHSCNGDEHGALKVLPSGRMSKCEGGISGLFDMSGNLWEFIDNCREQQDDSGTIEVCPRRGGSVESGDDELSCAAEDPEPRERNFSMPQRFRDMGMTYESGFRCCKSM